MTHESLAPVTGDAITAAVDVLANTLRASGALAGEPEMLTALQTLEDASAFGIVCDLPPGVVETLAWMVQDSTESAVERIAGKLPIRELSAEAIEEYDSIVALAAWFHDCDAATVADMIGDALSEVRSEVDTTRARLAVPPVYPVVMAETFIPKKPATAPGSVVLQDFGPDAHHRFATHFRNEENPAKHYCVMGHYFDALDLQEARDDYASRVKRGY